VKKKMIRKRRTILSSLLEGRRQKKTKRKMKGKMILRTMMRKNSND
jgi:hypothetical protein